MFANRTDAAPVYVRTGRPTGRLPIRLRRGASFPIGV